MNFFYHHEASTPIYAALFIRVKNHNVFHPILVCSVCSPNPKFLCMRATKIWIWTSKIIPDLWLSAVFRAIKKIKIPPFTLVYVCVCVMRALRERKLHWNCETCNKGGRMRPPSLTWDVIVLHSDHVCPLDGERCQNRTSYICLICLVDQNISLTNRILIRQYHRIIDDRIEKYDPYVVVFSK